jgi:hypothetical protein
LQQECVYQLTYPDITSETNSEEHGKDYNSLGPELITVLIPPISVRLHQEDATNCQLFQTIGVEGPAYSIKVSTGIWANMQAREKCCSSA